jgi:hypothetical protein
LKVWGLGVDPVGRAGLLATPEAQLAIIEFEFAMGIWLLSGKNAPAAWLAAVLTFAIFAGVSLYLGLIGETSCGCAGRLVTMSPWVAFGIDLVVLGLLGLGWRHLTWRAEPREGPVATREVTLAASLAPVAMAITGVAILSAIMLALAYANFGSVPAAVAHFRGERVTAQRFVEVEPGSPGDSRRATVTITNWTDKPIRLIGGTSDCACTVLEDLPITIPEGGRRDVSVSIALTGKPGIYTRKAGFLIEDEGLRQLTFVLSGRILESLE